MTRAALPLRHPATGRAHPAAIRYALGCLLAFGALNAFGGGVYGMAGADDVPREWLEGSPFEDYFIPGLVLFLVVGGSLLTAAAAVFADLGIARLFALGAGAVVLVWLAVETLVIGYVSWMQPATTIGALLVILLAWLQPEPHDRLGEHPAAASTPHRGRARPARTFWLIVGLAVGAVLLAAVADRTVFSQDTQTARPELPEILDGLVTGESRIAPGATAYVAGPRGTWLGSAGLADVTTGESMRPDARMRLESVSKIWTAALILRLAQEGKLNVGDSVETWLPGRLPYGDRITIRQLLTMTSGLIDNNDIARKPAFYVSRVGNPKLRAQLVRLATRLEGNPSLEASPTWWIRLAAWQPLLFTPGTQFHYSNIGYALLGMIAARAGGGSLPALHRELILEPFELEHSAYDPQWPISGPHAKGYAIRNGGKPVDVTAHHATMGADGGIVSNAEDTATFLTTLMSGRLLDPEQLEGMRRKNLWLGGEDSGCAGPAYGWSGGGSGYKTNVWVNGDGTRVAVLLLNARVNGPGQPAADQTAGTALVRLYCAA